VFVFQNSRLNNDEVNPFTQAVTRVYHFSQRATPTPLKFKI